MERIFAFLCRCYGCPSDEFEYSYKRKNGDMQTKSYTPLAFSRELLGYFTCSDSWFDKYMVSTVIYKKYLDGYEQQVHKRANPFDIWEIM